MIEMTIFNTQAAVDYLNKLGYVWFTKSSFENKKYGQAETVTVKLFITYISTDCLANIEKAVSIGFPNNYRKEVGYIKAYIDGDGDAILKLEYEYKQYNI